MKVVIIGTGNVAYVLGKKIKNANHAIIQVVGRDKQRTETLASSLETRGITRFEYMDTSAEIYIVAVSDSALPQVAQQIKLHNQIVVHTAGAVSKKVMENCSNNYGVLYPLQTLRKEMTYEPVMPVLVDGNNDATLETLQQIAGTWSDTVKVANDEERLKIHVAAVVVNNFTNHLFMLAKEFCDKEGLDFNLLYPMIDETISRAKTTEPSLMQTGPASRKDLATIEKHLEQLKDYPLLCNLYRMFTENIISKYTKSK